MFNDSPQHRTSDGTIVIDNNTTTLRTSSNCLVVVPIHLSFSAIARHHPSMGKGTLLAPLRQVDSHQSFEALLSRWTAGVSSAWLHARTTPRPLLDRPIRKPLIICCISTPSSNGLFSLRFFPPPLCAALHITGSLEDGVERRHDVAVAASCHSGEDPYD